MSRTERRQLAREVNARIREIHESFGAEATEYELICECGTSACMNRIAVPPAAFEEATTAGRHLVAPGHDSGYDDVVARLLGEPRLAATG